MNDLDKVKLRIKKLLAMANSNSPREAATAAKYASKLMEEYQLTHADIIKIELKSGSGVVESLIENLEYSAWPRWLQQLAITVGDLFECKIRLHRTDANSRATKLNVLGYAADVQMVMWMYDFLYSELSRLADGEVIKYQELYSNKKILRNSFLMGAVDIINMRIQEIIAERDAERQRQIPLSDGTSLMVLKKEAIEDKFGLVKYKKTKTKARCDNTAYRNGMVAGKNVNLNRPLGSGKKPKALSN